jgi:hypothetical protein
MLWVIQRDFLQGKSVQQLVRDALAPVPNPHNDKAIGDTNVIRQTLTSIARNSTGYRCVEAVCRGGVGSQQQRDALVPRLQLAKPVVLMLCFCCAAAPCPFHLQLTAAPPGPHQAV